MMNFGFNLLGAVQSVIGKQDYYIERWLSSSTNDIGYDVDIYDTLEFRQGSVQPVDRTKYAYLGLDFTKHYIYVLDVSKINGLNRGANADRIHYNGSIYKILDVDDWSNEGGWNGALCIKVSDVT